VIEFSASMASMGGAWIRAIFPFAVAGWRLCT